MASQVRASKEGRPRVSIGDLLENKPPHDLVAEEALIGSILLQPDVCDEVATIVRPEDFYHPAHRILYAELLQLHNSQAVIDVAVLLNHLRSIGKYDEVGGAAMLARLVNGVPHAAHAKYYAQMVASKAIFRSLIEASSQILSEAYQETLEPEMLLNRAEQLIYEIANARTREEATEIREVLHEVCDLLEARMHGRETEHVVPTGYYDLDALLGRGLHESELVILAARPSMGKTALALNIAEHVVMHTGKPVLFVSLEMAARELAERLLVSLSRVNGSKLRNGTLSERDFQKVVKEAGKLGEVPLMVDDAPSRTVTEIAAAARRLARRKGLGLVVIDYLQLIEPDNPNDSRQEQVARIARRLKGMARDLRVPVLCLAQVNRQAEDSREHRPRLSHLRESGAIEQDADVVMFVHREAYYRSKQERDEATPGADEDEKKAEVIVAKQRNGPVGTIELVWEQTFMRFENRAHMKHSEFDLPADDEESF